MLSKVHLLSSDGTGGGEFVINSCETECVLAGIVVVVEPIQIAVEFALLDSLPS